MTLYPDSASCDVCLRGTGVCGKVICDNCYEIAVELGLDVDQWHMPLPEITAEIYAERKKRRDAQTT